MPMVSSGPLPRNSSRICERRVMGVSEAMVWLTPISLWGVRCARLVSRSVFVDAV